MKTNGLSFLQLIQAGDSKASEARSLPSPYSVDVWSFFAALCTRAAQAGWTVTEVTEMIEAAQLSENVRGELYARCLLEVQDKYATLISTEPTGWFTTE